MAAICLQIRSHISPYQFGVVLNIPGASNLLCGDGPEDAGRLLSRGLDFPWHRDDRCHPVATTQFLDHVGDEEEEQAHVEIEE